MKESRIETIELGGRTFRVRHWGPEDATPIFMLHGWIDCSASFQFVVDALQQPWHVIAPDWRGHGGSQRNGESYWLLQYIADLDALLEHYSPAMPVRIVAHSLGGNVGSAYSGTRPERIHRFVNLEGLAPVPGLSRGTSADQLARWLRALRRAAGNRRYATLQDMALRLQEANPRLTAARADFLARSFSRKQEDGSFEFDIDPYQYVHPPMPGFESVVETTWSQITAPVLLVTAEDSFIYKAFAGVPGLLERRLRLLQNVEHVHIDDAGHNLQHDQPERVAALVDQFMS